MDNSVTVFLYQPDPETKKDKQMLQEILENEKPKSYDLGEGTDGNPVIGWFQPDSSSEFKWGVYGEGKVEDLEWPTEERQGRSPFIMIENPKTRKRVFAERRRLAKERI